MTRLRSCEGCARHVFATEQVCPFCQTELAPAPERAQLPVPNTASRAQRLALAAALGSQTLLACAQTGEQEPPVAVPVYGAPVAGDQAPFAGAPGAGAAGRAPTAGTSAQPPAAGRGANIDAGVAVPVYGVPVAGQAAPTPDEDAGVDESVAGAGGSSGRGGMASPVYGAPIPEYGAPPPPED